MTTKTLTKRINRVLALVLTIAALTVGQSVWATTKTVTYRITDFSLSSGGSGYNIVFTRSGDAPFNASAPTTYTVYVSRNSIGSDPGNSGYMSLQFADDIQLSISWNSGSDIRFMNHCIYPNASDKYITYSVSCSNDNYYVTHVMMTGYNSNYQQGLLQPYPHNNEPIDYDYSSEWHFYNSYRSRYAFGQITITYADVPTLSIFESDGENAYKIKSKDDLRHLANYVNNGHNACTGLTFRQTQDITCDNTYTPIGYYVSNSDKVYFRGTYDGDGHTISGITVTRTGTSDADGYVGLFGYVHYNSSTDYGTVRNVVLASSTFTGKNNVGGIVGYMSGGIVENCRVESTVTINAGNDNAKYHGGIVGENDNGNAKVIGCYSAAVISNNGKSYSRNFGGIVGYNYGGTVKDCLYAGNTVDGDLHKGAIVGFDENNNGTFTNNYYTNISLGGVGAEGSSSDQDGARRARTVTLGEDITLVGDETIYNYSGITAIGTGNYALSYNDGTTTTIYSGEGQTLTLSYTGLDDGYTAIYSVNGAAIEGNTFQMPAANVTVSAEIYKSDYITHWQAGPLHDGSSSEKSYLITTPAGLQLFASEVNGGNKFSEKYFKLDSDIDMSSVENFTPIGNTVSNSFKGNFNGQGNTIRHLTITQTGGALVGLFGYLNGENSYPVVSNLTLDGANISAGEYVGGIVGHQLYCSVSNCHVVSSSISGTATDAKVGAIAGKFSNTPGNSLSNCTYHSTLVYANSNQGNAFNIGCGLMGLSNKGGDSNGAGLDATQLFVDGGRTDLATLLAAYNDPASYTAHDGTAPDLSNLTASVRGNVTIPSGSVFEAPTINIATGGSLTLADGAELVSNQKLVVTVQKRIADYTTDNDGWNLFAMPFNAGLNPTLINSLIPSDPNTVYDLYRLKENTTCWENYKQHESDFCIRPILGDGACLYATSVGTTLQKDGQIYPNTVEGDTAYLNKQGEGWNLIANPYTFKVYVNKPFLRMNAEGSALVPVANYWETPLNVCEGIVVKADSIFEPVIFTRTAPAAPSSIPATMPDIPLQLPSTHGFGEDNAAVTIISDNADNADIIAANQGSGRTVILHGRTLTANSWNTLCVPFNLSSAQIAAVFGTGTLVKTLSSYANNGTTVTITFASSDEIVAGKPYIIMPVNTVTNPVFSGVTIDKTMNDVTTGEATFKGTYGPTPLTANDKKRLFLANNKLWYPTADVTVKACRAYFELTTAVPELSNSAPNIVIDFGDNDATSITSMSDGRSQMSDVWYNIDGRKLSGKPTAKGIYIVNGHKVVIK